MEVEGLNLHGTEVLLQILHYLLPVTSQDTEQKAGISSSSWETIVMVELLWSSGHHQYSDYLLFWCLLFVCLLWVGFVVVVWVFFLCFF